ncbi:MAG: hypothetical protein KAI24_10885, partial [Planctomycetes bacterium]|nr:hypothetical protein [Planctomycetota bacterium]
RRRRAGRGRGLGIGADQQTLGRQRRGEEKDEALEQASHMGTSRSPGNADGVPRRGRTPCYRAGSEVFRAFSRRDVALPREVVPAAEQLGEAPGRAYSNSSVPRASKITS